MENKKQKILICGTRKKGYDLLVRTRLNGLKDEWKDFEIIELNSENSIPPNLKRIGYP